MGLVILGRPCRFIGSAVMNARKLIKPKDTSLDQSTIGIGNPGVPDT
jgi:hypothetical protein